MERKRCWIDRYSLLIVKNHYLRDLAMLFNFEHTHILVGQNSVRSMGQSWPNWQKQILELKTLGKLLGLGLCKALCIKYSEQVFYKTYV